MNLPSNIELEKTVLGRLLDISEFSMQAKYSDMMTDEFFTTDQTKAVFNAIARCVEQHTLASVFVVKEKNLCNNDQITDIITYQFDSKQKTIYQINELKTLDYRRKIMLSANDFIGAIARGENVVSDSESFLLNANELLSYGAKRRRKTGEQVLKRSLEDLKKQADSSTLVKYNMPWMDKRYNHERGQTHILAATPGTGKTAMALTITSNAIEASKRCVVFVGESSTQEMWERLIAMRAGIGYADYKFNFYGLNSGQQARIASVYKYLMTKTDLCHFVGINDYNHTASSISAILGSIIDDYGQVDICITDYVQNMRPPKFLINAPTHEKITYNAERLDAIHKEYNVAGIVLAQLNRDINKRPTITNLKGSSMLEQIGHIITFLHRDRNTPVKDGLLPTEIYCEKQRLGPEYAPIKIGLAVPSVEFIEGRFTESDRPEKIEKPKY